MPEFIRQTLPAAFQTTVKSDTIVSWLRNDDPNGGLAKQLSVIHGTEAESSSTHIVPQAEKRFQGDSGVYYGGVGRPCHDISTEACHPPGKYAAYRGVTGAPAPLNKADLPPIQRLPCCLVRLRDASW